MFLHGIKYAGASASEADTPIIILHGLFGSNRNWHPIANALSDKHIVYSLDLRNHGQSPHSDVMDYPHMAEDVMAFIKDQLQHITSVNIIAHSMGGKAAMWLALSHPEIVKKLIIVDIAPVTYQHDFSDVLNGFQSIPLHLIKSRQDADGYLSKIIHERSLRQFLLQNLQFKEGKYQWRLNLEAISQSISTLMTFPEIKNVESYSKRVLFVGGGRSDYLNKMVQEQTRVLFSAASFSMIKSAGHWLHAEQPELFKALIRPYLDSD